MKLLQNDNGINYHQRLWLNDQARKRPSFYAWVIMLAHIFIVALLGVRAIRPDAIGEGVTNLSSFLALLYMGWNFVFTCLFSMMVGLLAFNNNPKGGQPAVMEKSVYDILKHTVRNYARWDILWGLRFTTFLNLVFIMFCAMMGWVMTSVFLIFLLIIFHMIIMDFGYTQSLEAVKRLTPEMIGDFEAGKTESATTLITKPREMENVIDVKPLDIKDV